MPRGWRWFLVKFVVETLPAPSACPPTACTASPRRNNNIPFFNQARHTHTHSSWLLLPHTHTHREFGTNLFSSQLARKGLIVSQSAKVAHTHTHTLSPKYPSIYRFCITGTCPHRSAGVQTSLSAIGQWANTSPHTLPHPLFAPAHWGNFHTLL